MISLFFWKEGKAGNELKRYMDLALKEPGNAKWHLKIAEFHQKQGKTDKALKSYLDAAEIYYKAGYHLEAIALYKKVLKQGKALEQVSRRVADLYREMGLLGDAAHQYNLLLEYYIRHGKKEKAREVKEILTALKSVSPPEQPVLTGNAQTQRSFDLAAELERNGTMEAHPSQKVSVSDGEKFQGILDELKKRGVSGQDYPDYHFHLGKACFEMGYFDEALKELHTALEKRENLFGTAHLLALCYKKKGKWKDARYFLIHALCIGGVPKQKRLELEKELKIIRQVV